MPRRTMRHDRHRRSQVGVVPWRIDRRGGTEILLVTNRHGDRWTVPKGNVPRHLAPPIAAAREAFEEAGLIGPIGRELCAYSYTKRGLELSVTLYGLRPLVELPIWPEAALRRRAWLPIDEAVLVVHHSGLRRALANLGQIAVA